MKKNILIIEDELSLLELLVNAFEEEGFKVTEAKTAERGLKLALNLKPDLILLDIILPKMDGLTMLKHLRRDRTGKDVPVIILSNLNDQAKIAQALQFGVYDYLIKSNINLSVLIKQVKETLEM